MSQARHPPAAFDWGQEMRKHFRLAIAVLIGTFLATAAWADTIELRSGKLVKGKYLGGTQSTIRFDVDGKVEVFPIADVLALTFGEPAAPAKAPVAAAAPAPEAKPAPPPAAAPVQPTQPAQRPPEPRPASAAGSSVTVPAGTRILVRMIDSVDSDTNRPGDRFRASLEEDLMVDERVVARKGSDVYGRLAEVKEAGRIAGRSELRLELTDLLINLQLQPVVSGDYEVAGEGRGGQTARRVGGGAVAGAIIGAIAGGGKGAAIGAGVGAGAGTAVQIFTRGEQVRVPSETLLEFTITQSFTVRAPRE